MTLDFLFLCVLFAVKHFLGDWQFQTTWMVRGKRRGGFRFIIPLFFHCLSHGLLTMYVVMTYFVIKQIMGQWQTAVLFGGIDFISHFVIDRSKAIVEKYGWNIFAMKERCRVSNHRFQIGLNVLDQLLHGIVYLGIIYSILVA